jgi:hypothetical protein
LQAAATTLRPAAQWLENTGETIIPSTGPENDALLQGVRPEIDLRLSEVASGVAAKQWADLTPPLLRFSATVGAG